MRTSAAFALLFLIACSGGEPDPRVSEIWRVDLLTYESDVEQALAGIGIERREIESTLIAWLHHYFGELPVHFELGAVEDGPFKSSICIRTTDQSVLGWGVLDEGNLRANHACGDRDGISFGVFIDNIANAYELQTESLAIPREEYVEDFVRLLAVVVAHEIGHGLGLRHSGLEYGIGDIMRPPTLLRDVDYFFNPEHVEIMRENLERFAR